MSEHGASTRTTRPATSRVLIVEDVAAMRMFMRLALARAGMEVVEAESLAGARRALREPTPFTSVLLDLDLPDGDGLELLGEVPDGVPVAALTADDSRETALRCREAGCAALFVKGERQGDPAAIVRGIECISQTAALRHVPDADLQRRYREFLGAAREELEQARASGDLVQVRKVVHRLRGTAVHFGHARVGAGARAVSEAIAAGRAESITSAIALLRDSLLEAHRGPAAA